MGPAGVSALSEAPMEERERTRRDNLRTLRRRGGRHLGSRAGCARRSPWLSRSGSWRSPCRPPSAAARNAGVDPVQVFSSGPLVAAQSIGGAQLSIAGIVPGQSRMATVRVSNAGSEPATFSLASHADRPASSRRCNALAGDDPADSGGRRRSRSLPGVARWHVPRSRWAGSRLAASAPTVSR